MVHVVDESLSSYLDKAIKHYSSLFRLPSYKSIVLLLFMLCVASGLLSTSIFYCLPIGLVYGLLLSFLLLCITIITNYFFALFIAYEDPVYDLRRIAALSLFCWAFWLLFIFIGCIVVVFGGFPLWGIRFCFLGFLSVLILRFIVLYSTFSLSQQRFLLASFLQPILCLIPFVFLWWLNNFNAWTVLRFSAYSLIIASASSYFFIYLLNFIGKHSIGEQSLSIFKAFLLNWVANLNSPFENFLEKLSEERDVEVSIMRFDCPRSKVFIVVPSVHPGPFKNVGSSLLPSMLKEAIEQKFNGIACVPLGILGHELDVASQSQVQKIILSVLASADFNASETKATPFIKLSNGLATACCQIFGKTALIAFSLAPKTTEDFPVELGEVTSKEARKLGIKSCIAINAHNSINSTVDMKTALEALENIAVTCLEKAASSPHASFKVGAATIQPKEFHVKEGMGPGGITVIAIEAGTQKAVYVIFDGNNMVSGLREKILATLEPFGFSEGEVFTTDTHAVNAVTFNERGYHPIGEVMDHEKLKDYIVEAAKKALANMEPAKFGYHEVLIPKVKVIGKGLLEKLCVLTDRTIQTAKSVFVPLFGAAFLILMLLLLYV